VVWGAAPHHEDLSGGHSRGAIAKRLCNGLQIRGDQFDSGSRLQKHQ
jgi:hypothetical protein